MSENRETKIKIINSLLERDEWIRQVNKVEYRTRCPYCGDSINENTGHFYIRIDPDDNLPIVFNCFKCEESGFLREETLSLLGIDDIDLKSKLSILNRTSDKIDKKNISAEKEMKYFDFSIPEYNEIHYNKFHYIEKRLGVSLSIDECRKLKIIPSIYEFLRFNDIKVSRFNSFQLNKIENNYVGFLSYGNSHILFRDITDTEEIRWIKYPILPESQLNKAFYCISGSLDVFSQDNITINLSEGIMDILSAYFNLGYSKNNTMNIAVCGKYYESIILFIIDLGLVGSNIILNIFADNDMIYGRRDKSSESTSLNYYRRIFRYYKYLFKEINIFYNTIGKDIGVKREKISLKHYKL